MIAHKDQDGIVTLEWDDPEEHSVKVDREVLESMVAEINDARRLRRALGPFVTTPENVECQTCDGKGYFGEADDQDGCWDCNGTGHTPENVETP